MTFPARQSAASVGPAQLAVVGTSRPSADRTRRAGPAGAAERAALEPFAVEVRRRRNVTLVQARGELDIATAETLRSTLDAVVAETLGAALVGSLVLDLRGLTFIDSSGLHLLVTLDQRAQRDGFELTLVAPLAPIDRAIQLCGLDRTLPFAAPVDAVDAPTATREPANA